MTSIVLFDTEFTAWPGSMERNWSGPGEYREVIQLAALKLSFSRGSIQVKQSFNELICPQLNPTLSEYVSELTGITQQALDNHGVDFASALQAFYQFTDRGKRPCLCWGQDHQVLQENARLIQLTWPAFSAGFTNMVPLFERAGVKVQGVCSGDVHKLFQKPVKGEAHNALHDVRSLAISLEQLLIQERITWTELLN